MSDHRRDLIEQALDFLISFPNGEKVDVVAIPIDRGPIARTFGIQMRSEIRKFLEQHEGKSNLYFHPNELRPEIANKKAKKEDIKHVHTLFVDIDDLEATDRIADFELPP
ncbi:MAG: hypothetical protein AAF386_01765, partial [Pseudomonadota bacterium]